MLSIFIFFFFNDTATTEIYTLSLHDALPIWSTSRAGSPLRVRYSNSPSASDVDGDDFNWASEVISIDRKSTRLNSSHGYISYAVFCLKKKKSTTYSTTHRHLSFDYAKCSCCS